MPKKQEPPPRPKREPRETRQGVGKNTSLADRGKKIARPAEAECIAREAEKAPRKGESTDAEKRTRDSETLAREDQGEDKGGSG